MKKNKIIVLIITMALLVIFPLTINAAQIDPDDYQSSGPSTSDVKDMFKFGGSVAGAIQIVGTIVSVGVMMILGIRYMLASADEKAEYRERILPYFIGAILLFGASNIVKVIYNVSKPEEALYALVDGEKVKLVCKDCGKPTTTVTKPCSNCGGTTSVPETDYNKKDKNEDKLSYCPNCNLLIPDYDLDGNPIYECPTCGYDGK